MADSKLTALTATTTPVATDIAYTVVDPGGTPLDRKITWANASKVISPEGTNVLSTGEAGGTKFLREDGDGTCSWQDVAGGLTGDNAVTIGSSGDYEDLAAAIAGESTPYNFKLVENVTEDSDVALDGSTYVNLNGFTYTLGGNNFTYAAEADIVFDGQQQGGEFDYTSTTETFANSSFTDSIVEFRNLTIDCNNASSIDLHSGVTRIFNCDILCPNTDTQITIDTDGFQIDNVRVIGAGTSTSNIFTSSSGARGTINNVILSGTFLNDFTFVNVSGPVAISNITNESADRAFMRLAADGIVLTNLTSGTGSNFYIDLTADNCTVANIGSPDTPAGLFDPRGTDRGSFTNMFLDSLDLTDGSHTNNRYTNVRVNDAVTLDGDRNKFTNCDFLGGGTVVSGADDNGFVNCQFGPDGGGGATTLTIDSGSNRTRVGFCMSDAAISDSGTGSVIANNAVY